MAPGVLPSHAEVVVVGGGVMGASIAYQLALRGRRGVILLERHGICSGFTRHSTAVVRQHYAQELLVRMSAHGHRVFSAFEDAVGGRCGYNAHRPARGSWGVRCRGSRAQCRARAEPGRHDRVTGAGRCREARSPHRDERPRRSLLRAGGQSSTFDIGLLAPDRFARGDLVEAAYGYSVLG